MLLTHREFVYVGDSVPKITEQDYAAFLLQLQKAMLASLEKRELLSHSQYGRCIEELETQYRRKNRSQA